MTTFRFMTALAVITASTLTFGQVTPSPVGVQTNHSNLVDGRGLKPHAQSPEDYKALAARLHQQEEALRRKAAAEKRDWEQRSQITTSLYAKYPKPADSARNLYEYYTYEANKKQALAAEYEEIAAAPQGDRSR
jgi:hypothetical protein